jgi:hypothetical protein
MSSKRRRNVVLLILVSFVYFLLFIPPNLTGAKDPEMLNAFWLDEHCQYAVIIRMLTRSSVYDMLHNILFYDYYPYGYPFFAVSALAALPVKIIVKLVTSVNETTAYMVVLRQLSPLFMIMAILLLIYLWTGFTSLLKSLFLFVMLSSIPAVFYNNLWWHPDSLAVLFVVLTMFSLAKDDLRFGSWFYAAAIFCGLATATKWLGPFFFFTIAVYLGIGWLSRRLGFSRLLRCGIFFLLLMAAGTLLGNPVLLFPTELARMVGVLHRQAAVFSWVGIPAPFYERPLMWYQETFRGDFASWWIIALALCSALVCVFSRCQKWLLNVIILTWAVPMSLYMLFTIYPNPRYFIPVFLPLLSCLANLLMGEYKSFGRPFRAGEVLSGVTALLCGIQLVYYTGTNVDNYNRTLTRERSSQPVLFYQEFERDYLSKLPKDIPLTVLCDSYVYVAPSQTITLKYSSHWNLDYRDCEQGNPDLVVLRREYIDRFADPGVVGKEADQEQAQRSHEFYLAAKNDSLKGFHRVFEADYCVVFARDR